MKFIAILGVVTLWILYAIVNAGSFSPYDAEGMPNITNVYLFVFMLSLGISALVSIPGGYLVYFWRRYVQKKRVNRQMKYHYLSWLVAFVLLIVVLMYRIFLA